MSFSPVLVEASLKPKTNTPLNWPKGSEWLHLVRRPPKGSRGLGGWYANVEPASAEGKRARGFAEWFEDQLESISPAQAKLPKNAPVSLWLRESGPLTVLDLRTPAVWRAIEELLPGVARDDLCADGVPGTSTLFGCDLGEYDPAFKALRWEGVATLLLTMVYDIERERVKLLWMPRLERKLDQQTQAELDRAAQQLSDEALAVPRLEPGDFIPPPRPDDRRFSKVERALDPDGVAPFFEDARQAVALFHDRALSVLQGYLQQLVGQALPTLEGNKGLAQGVLELADTFGACLFFRTAGKEIKQVRVRAVPVAGLKGSNSPAARAGKFSVQTVGAKAKTVSETVTFPVLVVARDAPQAARVFSENDALAGRPTASP